MIENNMIDIDGNAISLDELINTFKESKSKKSSENKAEIKRSNEQALKPYQAELIKLQRHLEETNQKMIILFEGRDAAGKGGTIRRVTRYMNEKHYRIVALENRQKNKEHNGFTKNISLIFQEVERSSFLTEVGITGPW